MKALTLWLPWAALFPLKLGETRTWFTYYRGNLLIHAAKGGPTNKEIYDLLTLWHSQFGFPELLQLREDFPQFRGKALMVVHAGSCVSTKVARQIYDLPPMELAFGDFSDGRFWQRYTNIRRFKEPFPVTGRQRLFEVPDSLIEGRELIDP